MENNNQRIIFDTPEDIDPTEIMFDILKKNGVTDAEADFIRSPEESKFLIFSNAVKDFFDKKLLEKGLIDMLRNKLKITEGNATEMAKEIKEKLIPFARKVAVATAPEENEKVEPPAVTEVVEKTSPKKIEKTIVKKSRPDRIVPVGGQPEIKEIKRSPKLGPDNYREPIE